MGMTVFSPLDRRTLICGLGGAAVAVGALARYALAADAGPELPRSVAGVSIPDAALAREAARMCRAASPAYLFNHCMRTYLFGALAARRDGVKYDRELLFVGSALHDLGLTQTYASKGFPFEMDGADVAKAFMTAHGVADARAELVWNAIAMHDSPLCAHQPAQVQLVGEGAGIDVFGRDLNSLDKADVDSVLNAFPRLGFKTAFANTLTDYCQRKPRQQSGTWTDSFCRVHAPDAHFPDLARNLADSPFAD